jgi:hypothetical protein
VLREAERDATRAQTVVGRPRTRLVVGEDVVDLVAPPARREAPTLGRSR